MWDGSREEKGMERALSNKRFREKFLMVIGKMMNLLLSKKNDLYISSNAHNCNNELFY